MSAPDQSLGGQPCAFVSWSDGDGQSHDVVVDEDLTLLATFAPWSDSVIFGYTCGYGRH